MPINVEKLKKGDGTNRIYMQLTDRETFLKYAVPCGQVLVKRGTITQDQLDNPEPEMFKVGLFLCEQSAKKLGKDVIDTEAIHQYFWYDHDDALVDHCKINNDVDVDLCTVYPGQYLGNNIVRLPIGERKVNIRNTPEIKEGEYVTVHYDSTCEMITKEDFEKLSEMKK